MASAIVFRHAGDQALLVEFENEISLEVSAKVKCLMAALAAQSLPGLGELIRAVGGPRLRADHGISRVLRG